MPAVITPIQIRFADLDMAHHVHNAVYLHWFELSRMELLRRFIPSGHDWKQQGLILARNEVDYRLPIHLHDRIEGHCQAGRIGSKSFDLHYRIVREKEGKEEICAEGRSVMVCFDYAANGSIELPQEWRNALAQLSES
ncbi:MAG TPA: thioesterase family protein [Flavobacteriales bacterium]|nr:thioesterase family protein [Flavobacteriales bacterium]